MTEAIRSARRLVGRWWPVALAVPLGAVAGAGYALVAHPSYAANSYVIVVPETQGEGTTAVSFAQAYGRLAGQPQVLAAAAAETGHGLGKLQSLVHGTTSPDAPMIEITGTGPRPEEAVRAADAVARSLVAFANNSSRESGVRLVPLAAAAEPAKPTTPSGRLDVAVGGAAGVLIGALVMMTRRRNTASADGEAPAESVAPAESAESATPVETAAPVEPSEPAATAPRPRAAEPAPVAAPEPEQAKPGAVKSAPAVPEPAKSAPAKSAPAVSDPAVPEPAAPEPAKAKAPARSGR
ncbi:hypothetical protein ACFVVU_31020 [Kitasatospora sp. NPDC057965]|uniref:hypothetical protein n=1 Tax=Kitasatospora sp. NPDC057965 TaxID=3346291 RepID=UPI0036D8FFF2